MEEIVGHEGKSVRSETSLLGTVSKIVDSITSEFEVAMGSPDRVAASCSSLRDHIGPQPGPGDMECLKRLFPLLSKRTGAIVSPLFNFLDEIILSASDPWHLIEDMLSATDMDLVYRSLKRALSLTESGRLSVDLRVAKFFAGQVEKEGSPLGEPAFLEVISQIMVHSSIVNLQGGQDTLMELYFLNEESCLRRLAARLLDLKGSPVEEEVARKVLGHDVWKILGSYLAFTRASHLELCYLAPSPGEVPSCLVSLKKAEALCGDEVLREVISEIGWAGLNLGLHARKDVNVSIGGAFPIVCSPAEAHAFKAFENVVQSGYFYVFVGHGGLHIEDRGLSGGDSAISMFRSYNLAHADVLAEMLSVAPLTREKVLRILDLMDRIVSDFAALFADHAEDTTILNDIYRELREQIVSGLEKETDQSHLSAGITRLVQMFDDPVTPGEIQTLHGLKRYLHQRGLSLGSRLAGSALTTNRTVTLAVVSKGRAIKTSRCIRYVDFEPDDEHADPSRIPYPVEMAADAFTFQILHGQEDLPDVSIFCYGNEIHYYLLFRNHPAFLRVDYSPPLNGGMIDLEYYGVSKYELTHHPDISLDAIGRFFRRLGFDFKIKDTRLHARYDKEKTLDLGDICEKAEAIFRLVPYLMEIDWAAGSLDLPHESRQIATEAWAGFFTAWGVLPLNRLLSSDRRSILIATEHGPTGEREVVWSGKGPYRDRLSTPLPENLFSGLQPFLQKLGLEAPPLSGNRGSRDIGQVMVDKFLLRPLRKAVDLGQIIETPGGFRVSPPEFFRREREAERFAEILASGKKAVSPSASLARIVTPLEQTLRFQTTGTLNGYDVQRAVLALRGESLSICVLRDGSGIIRLGLFAKGEILCLCRRDTSMPWHSNGSLDASELAALLRHANYLTPGIEPIHDSDYEGWEEIRAQFSQMRQPQGTKPFPGEKVLPGIKASPGRAVGRIVFSYGKKSPKDLAKALLVAPSVRPEDGPALYHSAGIISTGGGILSHAGLIALQMGKPALIISGEWRREKNNVPELTYRTFDYREEKKRVDGYQVVFLSEIGRHENRLQEGDLAILDAVEGTLRILGQDRETIAFHESLHDLCEATIRLTQTDDERKTLVFRGRRIRSLHQIKSFLLRLSNPVLARHSVHELLYNEYLSSEGGRHGEKAQLMNLVLQNPFVGKVAGNFLQDIFNNLVLRHLSLMEEIERQIPSSCEPYEVLSLRLRLLSLRQTLQGVSESLKYCGVQAIPLDDSIRKDIDPIVRERLDQSRAGLVKEIEVEEKQGKRGFRLRHIVHQVERLNRVLGSTPDSRDRIAGIRDKITQYDKTVLGNLEDRLVLCPEDGGLELFPHIGWKAANLAEVERVGGRGSVPPWFVVTNRAFREVLDSPADKTEGIPESAAHAGTVRQAIEAVLLLKDPDNFKKSRIIRRIWEGVTLPVKLAEEVLTTYHLFNDSCPGAAEDEKEEYGPYAAIRSSALEEDTEAGARPGEFDTFLFVRGEKPLLDYLKRTWAGLWTERAIHFRNVLGIGGEEPGGGVIIQRNAISRVSGVIQTVNIPQGNFREMVVNAGLGLGEGVVSGTVACDQITVSKEEILKDLSLRFRYVTTEKRFKVVLDSRSGIGTMLAEVASHERLRPALEYVELCNLVRAAARLENAYGYPLDIEFGIEGTKLWILQARPIATSISILRETMRRFPLSRPMSSPATG
ncbi:PEP/pyruvate-binding domain-containing protein [Thermodesulfobacteriota bacterium]